MYISSCKSHHSPVHARVYLGSNLNISASISYMLQSRGYRILFGQCNGYWYFATCISVSLHTAPLGFMSALSDFANLHIRSSRPVPWSLDGLTHNYIV